MRNTGTSWSCPTESSAVGFPDAQKASTSAKNQTSEAGIPAPQAKIGTLAVLRRIPSARGSSEAKGGSGANGAFGAHRLGPPSDSTDGGPRHITAGSVAAIGKSASPLIGPHLLSPARFGPASRWKRISLLLLFGFLLPLAGCGGGGAGNGNVRPEAPPSLSSFHAATSNSYSYNDDPHGGSNEPLNTDPTGTIGVVGGADTSVLFTHLERNPALLSTSLQHSNRSEAWNIRLRDGVSKNELVDYLMADAERGIVDRWSTPPTIRVAYGTSDAQERDVLNSVRLLNSALPPEWQIRYGEQHASPVDGASELRDGEIIVAFDPRRSWPSDVPSNADTLGFAHWTNDASAIESGAVWIDHTRLPDERDRIQVILHEIIHTLGRGHVPPSQFTETIMNPIIGDGADHLVLHALDQDALFAVHDRLEPGTPARNVYEELGPWSDVSNHVIGRTGYVPGRYEAVLYGAVERNGLVRPWAAALYPSPPATPLLGSASWSGRLLGLTPASEAVSGDANMSMDFGQFRGRLAFTSMESWPARQPLGEIGTGRTWGDGDLHYGIEASGSAFRSTGGDDGTVTGMFFGQNHENVGGTLRRSDLAAGFGAERRQ